VSPILFIIYLSGVFDAIERRVNDIQCLSFADDIGLLAPGYSVREVCDKLQEAAKVAIEWDMTMWSSLMQGKQKLSCLLKNGAGI